MKYLYLFVLPFFLLGCGKDGKIGPQGEKGEQGEKGIDGLNGSTIFSGKSAPTSAIGVIGDFYLNLSSGDLYGPKTKEGWGNPFNLKGSSGVPGSPGTPGATILSGQTIPTQTIGKNGDFYINLKDMTIYGPKTNAGWGSPVSLKPDQKLGIDVYLLDSIQFNTKSNSIEGSNDKYRTGGLTKTYEIPFINKENYLEFSYSISADNSPTPDFTQFDWQEFPRDNSIDLKGKSLNPDVSIETGYIQFQPLSTTNSKYKFNFYLSSVTNFSGTVLSTPNFRVMVRSYKLTKKASSLSETEKRYLRLR
ncbi:hypothetical protein ACK8HY_13815 [Sphingobacterium sp. NGMCC 1.201703]|uniref:hypothetical protein n=1 Tax=Sphingobacterium sp. NGMCC 1.201703 TaxID=3388657 RepID=UPI0039FD85A4